MRFLKYSLVPVFIAVLFFSSCKNDLELNAPYKEYPSVYAVLNPFEKIQMIRVNKVFLGEGDANVMAKAADSVNYKQDEITVSLKHSANPHIIVFKDSMVTTADGSFNTNQRIYVSNEKLDTTGFYTLTIKNTHTGNVFTSTASVIPRVSGNQGVGALSPPFYPVTPGVTNGLINYSAINPTTVVGSILFQPVTKGKIYQLSVRTHFYNDINGQVGSRTFDYVDYNFTDIKTTKQIFGSTFLSTSFKSGDYYANMALGLSKKYLPEVQGRKVYLMEYIIYASTQEYVDYMEYIKPSLSLNQNKPLYSNFKDQAALGIFTFRSTCDVLKDPDPVFITSFSTNSNTCKYKFYNTSDVVVGCK